MLSTIELKKLAIECSLGNYGPEDVIPNVHLLDLILTIEPRLVLIDADTMDYVFDYDPLIAEINRLTKDQHYVTQEWLMTRIVYSCAAYDAIHAIELLLSKRPVLQESGQLGVRLKIDAQELTKIRRSLDSQTEETWLNTQK